jgi:adenosine/AMP kinase
VEGVAKVGETLTAKVTPEKATVTYKWMRADAEDGEYVAIAGATDKTYTLSEADAGKWIKVEVKGTGNYTGTKSKVVGPVEEVEEPIETIEAIIDYNAVWNESRGTWYIKVTVPDENLDAGSVKSIHVIKEAGEELDEPRALTPDTDKVMWFGVAKGDGEVTLKADGEYAYKVVRTDGSEYIFSFTYTSSEVKGVKEVEEPIETIEAIIDYNAVWNESRGTWYIKVTVPDENLDAGSVQSIHAITEAGVDLDEPRELTPDTDKVMWFGVAKADGEVTLKADGEYAYKVVRTDGSKYIFNFTYDPSQVQGVTNLVAAALDAVNNATSADNYAAVRTALEENANKLGLNLDVYNQLTPDGRKNAVANDIYNNKPAGGYTIETLKPMFDEIVATRMVFQNSVALFAAASAENPLEDLSYITMLIENLEAVEHQTIHSGRSIKDDILPELNKLVEDFEALNEAQQEAVLASIDYTKSSSSTATRNALRAAITKVLEDEAAAVQAALDAVNNNLADAKGTFQISVLHSRGSIFVLALFQVYLGYA